jgi:Carboxypeptidase regulatory-like domain
MINSSLIVILLLFALSPDIRHRNSDRSCTARFQDPPCAEVWRSDVVFVGTAIRVMSMPFAQGISPEWQEHQKLTATLRVEESFRGNLDREVTFEMGDCYYPFKEGEKYLVYASKGRDGNLVLFRNHTRTAVVSDAEEDLAYLRGLEGAPEGGRIFGKVFDHRSTVSLRISAEPITTNRTMAGIKLTARSGERTYEAVTDETGSYEFTKLPEGEYTVKAALPDHLSGTQELVRLFSKGCAPTRFSIQATGVIAGRLVDSEGRPLKNAVVTSFSAEGIAEEMLDLVKPYYATRNQTDEGGSFSFARLPAGRYLLAVNLVTDERLEGSHVTNYPRMFYPGTINFQDSKAITLDNGKQLNVEFRLDHPSRSEEPSN